MAYCNDQDIRALLEGTQYLRQGNELDFRRQIANAQAWVDGRLEAMGLEPPLSSPPSYVKLAAANYACYLITRRPNVNGEFDSYSESFRRDALEMIDNLAAGKADIPGKNTLPKAWSGRPTAVNPKA